METYNRKMALFPYILLKCPPFWILNYEKWVPWPQKNAKCIYYLTLYVNLKESYNFFIHFIFVAAILENGVYKKLPKGDKVHFLTVHGPNKGIQ
jgi:hypothetical protein